ncbi:MAG: hypothetical protein ABI560_18320, partial [Myxococcales bacterium]
KDPLPKSSNSGYRIADAWLSTYSPATSRSLMSMTPAFVCSMCRKPIAVGGKVIRCSVSTCNSGRVKLVFCSAGCWDSHLPTARHRSAYFVEEIARRE